MTEEDGRVRWSTVTVTDVRDVATGIKSYVLRYGRRVHAAPGSHIDVMVQVADHTESRSYSVVRANPAEGTVTIAVRLAAQGGGGSRYMHGLSVGDRMRVTDPLQNFPLTLGRPGYVLVAAGIGITPLLPMFRALRDSGAAVRLIYVARDHAAMAFLDEMDERVELVIGAEGNRLDAKQVVSSVGPDHDLYVCGPIGVLEALRAAWRDDGRAPNRFRFETFGSSGQYAAEEFIVEVPRLSLRTTVPADRSILDALSSTGADMMFDCRRGECGLCEVRIVDCDGVVDHRDVFFSADQHAQNDYLCTCVSRVVSRGSANTPATLVLDLP